MNTDPQKSRDPGTNFLVCDYGIAVDARVGKSQEVHSQVSGNGRRGVGQPNELEISPVQPSSPGWLSPKSQDMLKSRLRAGAEVL